MTFEEWWEAEIATKDKWVKEIAKIAWDYQQKIIDDFKQANNDLAKAAIRPDGYVLVPVEPTEKMLKAGEELEYFEGGYGSTCDEFYKAMIQAAQEEE